MNDVLLQDAEEAISEFFKTDPTEQHYGQMFQKANLGMRLIHEKNTNSRIEIDQKIRIIGMAFVDAETREKYARATMPKILPDLKERPGK